MRLKGHEAVWFFKAPRPGLAGEGEGARGAAGPQVEAGAPALEQNSGSHPTRTCLCARAEPGGRGDASSSLACPHGGTPCHQKPLTCHKVHPPSRKIPQMPPKPLHIPYSYCHANPGNKAPPSDAVTKGLSPAAVRLGRLLGSGLQNQPCPLLFGSQVLIN